MNTVNRSVQVYSSFFHNLNNHFPSVNNNNNDNFNIEDFIDNNHSHNYSLKCDFLLVRKNTNNVTEYLNSRCCANKTNKKIKLSHNYGLLHLIKNNLLKENSFDLNNLDKIYCSQWLTDDFIIFGTKCMNLVLLNINNRKLYYLPNVESRNKSVNPNGIFFITINHSRTLLATGSKTGNDIVIYRLPTLDILYVLECHSDIVYDVVWLDDEFIVSGSKDSKLILWKISSDNDYVDPETNLIKIKYIEPMRIITSGCDIIRCLKFNKKNLEIAVLSSNMHLNIVDVKTMKYKSSCYLTYKPDLFCLEYSDENNLYAVASKSHIQLIDSKNYVSVSTINSKYPECGMRSLSFNSNILTIGTGIALMLFYDIKNSKYFKNYTNSELITLKAKGGWIRLENEFVQQYDGPAIYTHSYDESKTRLFTAGGPLSMSYYGNYAAIWM